MSNHPCWLWLWTGIVIRTALKLILHTYICFNKKIIHICIMEEYKKRQEITEKEFEEYSKLLDDALQLSEELMLIEKAKKDEDVVISTDGKNILRIPAKKILKEWDKLMDRIEKPYLKANID